MHQLPIPMRSNHCGCWNLQKKSWMKSIQFVILPYSDVTWTSWHLKSPTIGLRIVLHYWLFCEGISKVTGGACNSKSVSVLWRQLAYHPINMLFINGVIRLCLQRTAHLARSLTKKAEHVIYAHGIASVERVSRPSVRSAHTDLRPCIKAPWMRRYVWGRNTWSKYSTAYL